MNLKRRTQDKNQDKTSYNQFTLRRTAKEAKKSRLISRFLLLIAIILILLVALMYLISYFYDKLGSFTIKVDKYDMTRQGIILSENEDMETPKSLLNAGSMVDLFNIAGKDLPDDLDQYEGSHNGKNYIAYSFYLANSGQDTVSVKYSLDMDNITMGIDEAIRIRVYQDGEYADYAKAKKNGEPESGTTPFESYNVAMSGVIDTFSPGDKHKYTVVIWLEGNDPECVNDIIGGQMKMEMNFNLFESS